MGQSIEDEQLQNYILQDNLMEIDTSYDEVPQIHIDDQIVDSNDDIIIPDPQKMLAYLDTLEIYFNATVHPGNVSQIREMKSIVIRHLNFS
jgi:hypothetical protein